MTPKRPPPFRWNPRAGQYVRANGRFVPRAEIRRVIDLSIGGEQRAIRDLTEKLRRGAVSLEEWRDGMRGMIKAVNLYSAVAARGGWAAMTSADYGRAGAAIRKEYGYLENFVEKIASGRMALDGHVALFAAQYAGAGRTAFQVAEREATRLAGFRFERNVLHSGDSCPGCLIETGRGWVDLGTISPIGSRDCRRNCRCTIDYAKTLPE